MSKLYNAVGDTYGRLTVLESLGVRGKKQFVKTQCSCGSIFEAVLSNIRSGNTLSCGCIRKEVTAARATTHGLRNTRLYRVYTAMIQRCCNPNDRSYTRYGGRGVTVCDEWKNSIEAFINWANTSGYSDDLELDRIEVNLGYSPENCRWSSEITQARNRRTRKHTSIYTGVYFNASKNKWVADITVNKLRTQIGLFASEKEAWIARCAYIDCNNLQDFQTNRN